MDYDKNFKASEDFYPFITPQRVANYIASRIKSYSIVIDANCGVGGCTIQLAKECMILFAIDINSDNINFAKENCIHYKLNEKNRIYFS